MHVRFFQYRQYNQKDQLNLHQIVHNFINNQEIINEKQDKMNKEVQISNQDVVKKIAQQIINESSTFTQNQINQTIQTFIKQQQILNAKQATINKEQEVQITSLYLHQNNEILIDEKTNKLFADDIIQQLKQEIAQDLIVLQKEKEFQATEIDILPKQQEYIESLAIKIEEHISKDNIKDYLYEAVLTQLNKDILDNINLNEEE